MFGIISGSGLYDIPGLEIVDSVKISTPYGEPSDVFRIGDLSGKKIAFLPRHGIMHHLQPHKINYRANIWGFRELGVNRIISIGASGGISIGMSPGVIAVPDQLIDMTKGRPSTFYDEDEVIHIDFTVPFCPDMRNYILNAAGKAGVAVAGSGTYLCTNGPRLETAAEIRAFATLGCDMVGMTVMPEAALARELEICFAGINVITNHAAGIKAEKLTAKEVVETMQASSGKLKSIFKAFFAQDFPERGCPCAQALKNAKI
ncbi:MAG: S-methyl-5'-thioadenosine phosphorylase [Nitrospirota bacterium]